MPTATFQDGPSYSGTLDTTLQQAKPDNSGGAFVNVTVDAGAGVQRQGLLEFTNLFGDGPGQIPIGSTITSAVLTLSVADATKSGGSLYRMTTDWNESSTWNTLGNGVQIGTETVSTPDLSLGAVALGTQTFDVTSSLQAWLSGATTATQANAANEGWLFTTTSTDEWKFSSSEGTAAPILTVTYTAPPPPPGPQIAIEGPISHDEGASGATTSFVFTVDRTGDTSGSGSVDYAITGSGTNPADASDFISGVLPSGTVTFAAGETSQTITVNVAGDSIIESNEDFTVTLSGATNGATITGASTTGTIVNDDLAAQLALQGPVSLSEGTSTSPTSFVFTVNRTGDTSSAVSVDYGVSGSGTNPADASDFASGVLPSGTVNFAAGQTSQTITINVAGDTTVENDENFLLTLTNPSSGATITGATATGTIVNDDTAPTGPVTTTFQEGASYTGTLDTTLQQLKPDTDGGALINLNINGSAGAQRQGLLEFTNIFGSGPGQIPIGATITSATLTVSVGDSTGSGSGLYRMTSAWNENSTWNSLGNGVQIGTETVATADLSPSKVAAGTHAFNVTSSLQAWLSGATTAADANAANLGWLFNSTSSDSWKFASSEGSPAPILSVTWSLGGPPPPPQLALAGPVTANEGTSESPTSFVFTVNRTGDASAAASVKYAVTSSGSHPATFGDFTSGVLPSGTVNFAAGETSKTIVIKVVGDTSVENDETFKVTLSSATGATISGATATGTIVSDDLSDGLRGVHIIAGSSYGNGDPNSVDHYGSTDPTDIAYNPVDHTFLLVDSEIDENPFFGTVNMWQLDSYGQLLRPVTLEGVTHEPTGIALWVTPSGAQHLFITDDNQQKILEVDLANPSVLLNSFLTTSFGCVDPEDITINPNNGNLFVMSENDHTIYEITQAGSLVTKTVLPKTFVPHTDPNAADAGAEAIAYDPVKNVFWVTGGFSPDIFEVSRSGQILNMINVLEQYPNPSLAGTGQTVYPKGLELAPSSDGSGHLSLWVTDYGRDQYPDGRVIEIMLPDWAPGAAPAAASALASQPLASPHAPTHDPALLLHGNHGVMEFSDFRAGLGAPIHDWVHEWGSMHDTGFGF